MLGRAQRNPTFLAQYWVHGVQPNLHNIPNTSLIIRIQYQINLIYLIFLVLGAVRNRTHRVGSS